VGPFEKEDASAKRARSGAVMECTAEDPGQNRFPALAERPVNALPELPTRVGAMARAVSIPHRRRFRRTLTTSACDRRQPPWPSPSSTAATSGPHIWKKRVVSCPLVQSWKGTLWQERRYGQATEEQHSWCKNYFGKAEMTGRG